MTDTPKCERCGAEIGLPGICLDCLKAQTMVNDLLKETNKPESP